MDIKRTPPLLVSDLEGIFLPEIWIAVAEKTGIEKLRLTTRDIDDYDALMRMRLDILDRHSLTIHDIQAVVATLDLLPGAADFLAWARSQAPTIIITDSYYELIQPFMPKLGFTTVFAHSLETAADGKVTGYRLRVADGKRKAVAAFREVGFRTLAIGDSYNDTAMLLEADTGILFHPPANVVRDFPTLPVTQSYAELQRHIERFVGGRMPVSA